MPLAAKTHAAEPRNVTGTGRKTHAEMTLAIVDGHIAPRVAKLHDATLRLAADLEALCSDPAGAKTKSVATESFARTVDAWGAIDYVRFGPAADKSRLERFFFWPDPRAITERQLQAVLAKRDPALLAPGSLRSQSAAVQGLGALEFLLFNDTRPLGGTDEDARYRCAYAAAIAANLEAIAREIEAGWEGPEGWRAKMLAPGSDNPIYRDASETARQVVKSFLTGLQIVQDRQILPRLEAALANPPKRLRLPLQRSGLSDRYLAAELASLSAFFDATGLVDYVPTDKPWMKAFIPRAFDTVIAETPRLQGSKSRDELIGRLRKMRFNISGMRQIVGRELAPRAEIILGFNELDGD